MCGIVGYVGAQQAAPILLDGLRRLEYRGYDSAGMAVCGPEGLRVCKTKGRLQALAELMRSTPDARRAQALRATVTQTLQSELPVIPIAWYRQHVAVNRRLQGVSLDPLERSYRLNDMHWSNA